MRWMLVLLVALTCAAGAGDHYKEVVRFEQDRQALILTIEYRADGDLRCVMRVNHGDHGSSLFFTPAQWKQAQAQILAAMDAGRSLTVGGEGKAFQMPTAGGSFFGVKPVRPTRKPALELARIPDKGDSYPAVPVTLDASHFSQLRSACAQISQELAKQK